MFKDRKYGIWIEILILGALILVHVLEFLKLLPGDVAYVKSIMAWTGLAYIFYRASLTKVFFGSRNKILDSIVVCAYFMLFFKSFIGYVVVSVKEAHFLNYFYKFIIENAFIYERYSFYMGCGLLALLSLYFSFTEIKKESLLGNIVRETGKPSKNLALILLRFVTILLVLIGFFIVVFNLAMEWLAIIVDADIVVFALFFYLFVIVGHFEKFNKKGSFWQILYKIGEYGSGFYGKFVDFFHSKKKFPLAIAGMLVLHLLTDLGVFIVPYVIGINNVLYSEMISGSHLPIYSLLKVDMALVSTTLEKISLVWIYYFNLAVMLFLLVMPAFIWYNFYRNRGFRVPRILIFVFFVSFACFLLTPVFSIKPVNTYGLVGVDIQTSNVLPTKTSLIWVPIISFATGLLAYLISFSSMMKHKVSAIGLAIVLLFFGFYIYYFCTDTFNYYKDAIGKLFSSSEYIISFYFALFLVITLMFYAASYLIFLSESVKEYKRIR